MTIKLPNKKGSEQNHIFDKTRHLCIIGANGSGKTRFAIQIGKLNDNSIVITAQKDLKVPETQTIKDVQASQVSLIQGSFQRSPHVSINLKSITSSDVIYDYDRVLDVLFSEEASGAIKFKSQGGGKPPVSKLDQLKKIWETLLPHKILNFENLRLEISDYSGKEGSDGERLIFYIIGKVLTSPPNSIIIIDEPENNLHKAILKQLYNELESKREDCNFAYVTHDIDFAVSRKDSTNIWIKEYCTQSAITWDYEVLDSHTPISEHLYLEVLGSRNPILFIEGDQSSLDYKVYQEIYPNHTIKPVGSCQTVIDSVKSFNNQSQFHHIVANGIIDRDRREAGDVKNINSMGVWVLDVAEIENLFLLEEIVIAVQNQLGISGDIFTTVKQNVIEFFSEEIGKQVHVHLQDSLSKSFRSLQNIQETDISKYKQRLDELYADIEVEQTHQDLKTAFEAAITHGDYKFILRHFNEKKKNSIVARSEVHKLLNFGKPDHYIDAILRFLASDKKVSESIKAAIVGSILK